MAEACSQPHPYDVDAFCTDWAAAMCQVANVCSVDAFGCQQYQTTQCLTNAVTATSPDTRNFDPDNGHACIDAMQWAYDQNTIGFTQLQSLVDVCQRAYLGLATAGDFCRMDYDCAAGLVCVSQNPGGTPVVCATPQPVMQGQSCAAQGSQCPTGTYCNNHGSGSWICDEAPAAGQPCALGTYCASDAHCVMSMCQPRAQAGEACLPNGDDCAAASPYCDPYSKTCSAGLAFHPGNADCQGISGIGTPADSALEGGAGGD